VRSYRTHTNTLRFFVRFTQVFSHTEQGRGREVNGVFRRATLRVNLVQLLRGQFEEKPTIHPDGSEGVSE
jgi:hypothetical protein